MGADPGWNPGERSRRARRPRPARRVQETPGRSRPSGEDPTQAGAAAPAPTPARPPAAA